MKNQPTPQRSRAATKCGADAPVRAGPRVPVFVCSSRSAAGVDRGPGHAAKIRPPDPEENELIPITVESRRNSDSALIPAG